tara:strand:- start:1104 stop:2471 length:1368 start_codon:yes stop_codon:yes gene_type:complete
MKNTKKANEFIVNNDLGNSVLQMLGPNYFDKVFDDKREDDQIQKLGQILLDNNLFFFPIKYLEAFLDGQINEEELIMGNGTFTYPFDIQIGTPDLAIELAFGSDCKKNKSASSSGKKEEWLYYGEHREMKKQVIAMRFKFTDNRLTSFEDNSESAYIETYVNYKDFDNDASAVMSSYHVNTRRLFAQVSEGLTEEDQIVQELSIGYVKDTSLDQIKDLFEKDSDLDRNIEWFEAYNTQGQYDLAKSRIYLEKLTRYQYGTEQHQLHASEISHATKVLKGAEAEDDNIISYGQEFIDRYNELTEKRKKIDLMDIDELSSWGYSFDDVKNSDRYKKIYSIIENNYQESLPSETPFQKEYNDFTAEYEIYKEKKKGCFIATATMGDYDDPTVIGLRVFRDEYLDKNKWGRAFIKHYYEYSPFFANVIKKSTLLKRISYNIIVKPLYNISTKITKINNL